MKLRSAALILAIAAGATLLQAAPIAAPFADGTAGMSSTFSLSQKTQIPGNNLDSGDYSIQIINSLDDRMIVRVDGGKNSAHNLFLGIPAPPGMPKIVPGPVRWNSAANGTPALRGFVFPSGASVEFVYPKTQAVALATSNSARIVAIDPESEGRPAASKLSPDDLAIVNLWTLAFTTVGKDSKTPAIAASHYQPEPKPAPPVEAQLAEAKTVTPQPAPAPVQLARAEPLPAAQPAPRRHPAIARLPHTASPLPLIFLLGLLFLGLAAATRLLERRKMNQLPAGKA